MANEDKLIQQTERLLTVRPRSAAISPKDWVGGAGNRGTRARIRLLSSDTIKSQQQRVNSAEGFTSTEKRDYITGRLLNQNPGGGFSDFLLTSVNVSLNEKVQITQTFGDSETVYYFGKSPVIFNLGGTLIDDLDNQWFTTFVEAYTHIMRGTELARNFELIHLILPNMEVIGSVMGFSYQQEAGRDTDIPFTMQIHAKELRPVPVQIPAYAFSPEVTTIDFARAGNLTDFRTVTQINDIKTNAQKIKDTVQDPLSSTADIQAASERAGMLEDSLGWFDSTIDGPFSDPSNTAKGQSGASIPGGSNTTTASSTTTLSGFKASLFSPVFGVLTSITKVIKTVTGDISKIISSFTNPVNNVLRDIQGISTQAIAVVRLVEKSVNDIVSIPLRTATEIRNTVIALRNAAGIISRVPETIAQSIKRLTRLGNLKTSAAFLTKGGTKPNSKASLLNSGPTYTTAGASAIRR
jgi:hypothetical protein